MAKSSKKSAEFPTLQDGLKLMRTCPLCAYEFGAETVKTVEQTDESHLVHITCPKCLSAVLAMIVVSPFGLSSIGVLTDLDVEDAVKFREKEIFSADDVLDFYRLVESPLIVRELKGFEKY